MGYLTDWFGYAGLFVGLLVVVFVPGFITLRFLRIPRFGALALAPAWTFAIVGIGAIALNELSIAWNRASFVLNNLVVVLLCVIAWYYIPRSMETDKTPYGAQPRNNQLLAAAAMGGAVAVLTIPIMMRMDPHVPSGTADPMFHYNGVNAVLVTGNASMFGAMDANHGIRVAGTEYPSVWHAVVSLVASVGSIVPASHILTFVVTPIIWVIGMAYLGFTALPYHRLAALFVPLMTIVFPVFPAYLTVTKGFWPNGLALAATPAVIGAALAAYHRYRWEESNQSRIIHGVLLITVGVGVVGVTATHPSMLFTLAWVAIPTAIIAFVRIVRAQLRHLPRSRKIGVGALIGVAILIPVGVLGASQRVRSFLGRELHWGWEDIPERLVSAFAAWPVGKNPLVLAIATVIVAVALILGLRVVARHRHLHWIGYAWGMQTLLILGGYFPIAGLTAVAGLYYHDMYRLFSVQTIFLALICALAASEITGWLGKTILRHTPEKTVTGQAELMQSHPSFVGVIAGVTAVGLAVVALVYKSPTSYRDAEPRLGAEHILNSRAELEFIQNLDELIPAGSVAVGDPTTGIVYAPAYSAINSVFSQVNLRDMDDDGNVLAHSFRSIEYDPRVCMVLNKYGIGYYYEDGSITYQDVDRSERMPGLYNVDTANGYFDLVAEVDGARLWKISGCPGEMSEPNWWHLCPRRLPLLQPPLRPESGMPQHG